MKESVAIVMKEVASLLPGDWTYEDQGVDSGELTRSDGLKLWVRGDDKHVRISHSRPRDGHQYVNLRENLEELHSPSMGCSPMKSNHVIAKDIERRILAEAERQTKLVEEKIKQRRADDALRRERFAQLTEAMGKSRRSDADPERFELRLGETSGKGYGDLDRFAHDGGTCSITLHSVRFEVALKLLPIIQSLTLKNHEA